MRQGEIWLINLDPTVGAEIKKTRPCVLLSEDSIGALPLRVIAPIAEFKEKFKGVPWMVHLVPGTSNSLDKASVIDVFQLRSVSVQRLVRYVGAIGARDLIRAKDAIRSVFGL